MISSVKEVMNADQLLNPAKEDAIDRIEDLNNIVTCLFIIEHVISYWIVVITSKIICQFTYFVEENTSL